MKVLSLFSGGGLGDYGLELAGMEVVGHVEIDPYCQKILELRWPNNPIFGDIKKFSGKEFVRNFGQPDLISGGFPCQDISVAGKNAGIKGARSGLWKEMLRIIREVRPRYVLVENVTALLGRGLGTVLGDLAEIGYDTEWDCLPASAFSAPHQRDRVWIIAYSRLLGQTEHEVKTTRSKQFCKTLADAKSLRQQGRCLQINPWNNSEDLEERHQSRRQIIKYFRQWEIEPSVGRVVDGCPNRLDRLKLLGNGQVTFVVQWIAEKIMEFDRGRS